MVEADEKEIWVSRVSMWPPRKQGFLSVLFTDVPHHVEASWHIESFPYILVK